MVAKTILRALNQRAGAALTGVLAGLEDDQIAYRAPAIDERSIAEVALHAYGSLLGFASVVAGREWPDDLPAPGEAARLLALVDDRCGRVDALLAALPDAALAREVTLPWGQRITGFDAIADGLGHVFVHAGNLGGIRAIGGFPTPPEEY